jgi:hypothetical protein
VGIFESDKPTGPFEFVHALQPDGIPSLDMSLFEDPVDHTVGSLAPLAALALFLHRTEGLLAPPLSALGRFVQRTEG